MPEADLEKDLRTLMDCKVRQVTEAESGAISRVLPLLIFTLVVAWLLSLEQQITPLAGKLMKPDKIAARAKEDEVALDRQEAEIRKKEKKNQDSAEEIWKLLSTGKNAHDLAAEKKFEALAKEQNSILDQQRELRAKRFQIQKDRAKQFKDVGAGLKAVKEQQAKAENVEFKLPVLDIKVPRLAAPFCWTLIAFGMLFYVVQKSQTVARLTSEAEDLAAKLGLPKNYVNNLIGGESWLASIWPVPEYTTDKKNLRWPITFIFFWCTFLLVCLRVFWLSRQLLSIEEDGWTSHLLFLLTGGLFFAMLYLVFRQITILTRKDRSGGLLHLEGRRGFLYTSCGFLAGTGVSTIASHFFGPPTLKELASELEALRPKPNGSSTYHRRRRRHFSDPSPFPKEPTPHVAEGIMVAATRPSGFFISNGAPNSGTVHYIFPAKSYAANKPHTSRKRKTRRQHPNPAPINSFIRWGKAPQKWSDVPVKPEDLLLKVEKMSKEEVTTKSKDKDLKEFGSRYKVPHVALNTAAASFEHAILNNALGEGDLPFAIALGMAAIRHDLIYIDSKKKPNYRIYDLTAGILIRAQDDSKMLEMIQLIEKSPHSELFAARIAKWLDKEGRWHKRWSRRAPAVWARHLISEDLLMQDSRSTGR